MSSIYTTLYAEPKGYQNHGLDLGNADAAFDDFVRELTAHKAAAFMQHMTPDQWQQLRVTYLERMEAAMEKESEKALAGFDRARDQLNKVKELRTEAAQQSEAY